MIQIKKYGIFLAIVATALFAQGCVEVMLKGVITADHSGMLNVRYVIVEEMFLGKYAEFSDNNLLPLNEEEIKTFASRFPGVSLHNMHVEELGEFKTHTGRKMHLRRIEYSLTFKDINELKTNHFRFAYYPYQDKNYFQLRINKNVPAPDAPESERPTINTIAKALTADKALHLEMEFPDQVLESNGQAGGANVSWKVPMAELVASPTPLIVTWAKLPLWTEPSALDEFMRFFGGQSWKDPADLATQPRWLPDVTTVPQDE